MRRTGLLDIEPQHAFDRLTRLAARLLRAPVALVSLVEDRRQFFVSALGLPEPWRSQRETPLSHSVCQYAVDSAAPVVIPDLRRVPGSEDHPAIADLSVVAYLGIPLIWDDHVLGSFCVIDAVPREWTDDDVTVMTELAGCVMTEVALRAQARRAEQVAGLEHLARMRSELLAELGRHLPVAQSVEARSRLVAELLVPAFADGAWIEEAPTGDASTGRGAAGRERPDAAGGGEARLGVPFVIAGEHRRTLVLSRAPGRGGFDEQDERFAETIARQVEVSLTAAHLWEEERRIARRLQLALLPTALAVPPGIEVAARYQASTTRMQVGGDWYDSIELPDGRLALSVGDVGGHGLDAAAAMGRIRTAVGALAPHTPGPAVLLDRLATFAAGPDGCRFATTSVAVVDARRGTIAYATAGHLPMLVVAPDGSARWVAVPGSPPLFGSLHPPRTQIDLSAPPGSLLLLFSDGLVERRGEVIDVGLARLLDVVRAHRHAPLDDLCDRVLPEVLTAGPQDDDAVILAARL